MPEPTITHLERRKIEAGVLIPMIEAFQRAIGKERANEIAREVIIELARKDGARWAQQFGDDLSGMERASGVWAAGGSLDIEPVGKSAERLDFNVTRCRYAEFYKALGLPELGRLFHCNRDFAMVEGFSPGLTLERTQTIMEGAAYCDFRFRRKDEAPHPNPSPERERGCSVSETVMSSEVAFEGGCLCGAVRYRATAAPVRGVICHCTMCRKHSGAPVLAFVHFPVASFQWIEGEPTRYRSSAYAERGFCSQCGSTLTMHEEILSERVLVAVGSLDAPERVRPDDHVWTQDQLPWFEIEDRLPRFRRNSSAVPTRALHGDQT